jgi:hypothetical protein
MVSMDDVSSPLDESSTSHHHPKSEDTNSSDPIVSLLVQMIFSLTPKTQKEEDDAAETRKQTTNQNIDSKSQHTNTTYINSVVNSAPPTFALLPLLKFDQSSLCSHLRSPTTHTTTPTMRLTTTETTTSTTTTTTTTNTTTTTTTTTATTTTTRGRMRPRIFFVPQVVVVVVLVLGILVLLVLETATAFSGRNQQHYYKQSHQLFLLHRHRSTTTTTSRLMMMRTDTGMLVTGQENDIANHAMMIGTVPILPAHQPLSSFTSSTTTTTNNKSRSDDNNNNNKKNDNNDSSISILTWNILLPNSKDNWWNPKLYAPWVSMEQRQWPHRKALVRQRLLQANADIICLQETNGDTFQDDFDFLIGKNKNNDNNNNSTTEYDYCIHTKFRFRCATFFKRNKFTLEQVAHNKDRVLVTALKQTILSSSSSSSSSSSGTTTEPRLLNIVNCHLSGGAAPDRRLKQVHEGLDQIRKWKDHATRAYDKQVKANRPSAQRIEEAEQRLQLYQNCAVIVCGDFNSDGNTGVRQLLTLGRIHPTWREPQYPTVELTSKPLAHEFGLVDAAELAYGANVCDGDYGDQHVWSASRMTATNYGRPATYVVPNLISRLLLPAQEETVAGGDSTTTSIPQRRTQFGRPVAQGLADTLGLQAFCETELNRAFQKIDLDGNNLIDDNEVETLLRSVYHHTYHGQKKKGQQQQEQIQHSEEGAALLVVDNDEKYQKLRANFWGGSPPQQNPHHDHDKEPRAAGLSREQVTEKLKALQQELEGGNEGAELVEIRTNADVQRMMARFTPVLQEALDLVFDKYSSRKENGRGEVLSQDEINEFLMFTNGQLARGGTWRHAMALLENKAQAGQPAEITRLDWYEIFARELGEGKWWQVVHDLEACGATNLRGAYSSTSSERSHNSQGSGSRSDCHYQGWLDYVYFDMQRLQCRGVQEALTEAELSRIHQEGDALPNEWHPSDHLPVAAVFSWQS